MARKPDDEKKTTILEVAFELFRHKGYQKTTIKDIADLSNLAPGSIYTYFPDKKKLFYKTTHNAWKKVIQCIKVVYNANEANVQDFIEKSLDDVLGILFDSYKLLHSVYSDQSRHEFLLKNIKIFSLEVLRLTHTFDNIKTLQSNKDSNLLRIQTYINGILFHYSLLSNHEERKEYIKIIKEDIINLLKA